MSGTSVSTWGNSGDQSFWNQGVGFATGGLSYAANQIGHHNYAAAGADVGLGLLPGAANAANSTGAINLLVPQAPALQTPDAAPTQGQASTTALQNQLQKESNARAASTGITGGAGLLDNPTTTSRVLLGA